MKRLKRETGQSLVEFALVLPILILLLCGIIDFGFIFSNKIAETNAARDAARYCSINASGKTANQLKTAISPIVTADASYVNTGSITVTLSPSSGPTQVTVSFTASVPCLTGIMSTLIGSTVTMPSSCTMQLEQ